MHKIAVKYILIICAVLMIGQLDINRRQLGSYFTSAVKAFGLWTADRLAENPLIAKIINSKGVEHWFPLGEMSRKEPSVRETQAAAGSQGVSELEVSKEDEDEFSENEIDPEPDSDSDSDSDDTAVMAILP